jgi:hypothetical protein
MNKAVQFLLGLVALGFIAAAFVVLIGQLTGERPQEFLYPCFLLGGGLLAGRLAWNFGSDAGSSDMCSSDDSSSETQSALVDAD